MTDLTRLLHNVTRPGRYVGGEWNSVRKDWRAASVRLCLCYPDVYEVGMSNYGLNILYEIVNSLPDALAERVFAPWVDMEAALREAKMPLFSLESRHPLADFDLIGFSLGSELTYTNLLNLLDLAGLPQRATERDGRQPLVIAGGSGAYNPEPLAAFVDLFVIGDGEEALPELLRLFACHSRRGAAAGPDYDKQALLRAAAGLEGVYVPSLYQDEYDAEGWLTALRPLAPEAPAVVRSRLVETLPPAPLRPIVPTLNTVHDRAAIEVMRGCPNACRFCQAGHVYRPVRRRSAVEVCDAAVALLANTGYQDLSLLSLSTGDYPQVDELVRTLAAAHPEVNLSLPSLRTDSFSVALAESIQRRRASLTFAPEAGSQRLRDVINKRVTEADLLQAARAAYGAGWSTVKLYFMIGLPSETEEDVLGIARLAEATLRVGREAAGRRAALNVSVSTFVPKPHTPFQWVAQLGSAQIEARQALLRRALPRQIHLAWHDWRVSLMEAALARGDRRLGEVILRAQRLGCRFDAWSEHFRFDLWQQAAREAGLALEQYAQRAWRLDELLPWAHIESRASAAYLKRQYQLALVGQSAAAEEVRP